jgi:Uma2 family endonuclease
MSDTSQPNLPTTRMTVDEFLAWAEENPGRYELYDGQIFAMAAERATHVRVKFKVQTELARAISAGRVPCEMFPDGMNVRINEDTAHEPDALVYCGPKVPDDDVEIPNPTIIVEVLSPSTKHVDATMKLHGYFKVASIAHYLIIDPKKPLLILHSRQPDGTVLTRFLHEGPLRLDPPGIDVEVGNFFPRT